MQAAFSRRLEAAQIQAWQRWCEDYRQTYQNGSDKAPRLRRSLSEAEGGGECRGALDIERRAIGQQLVTLRRIEAGIECCAE